MFGKNFSKFNFQKPIKSDFYPTSLMSVMIMIKKVVGWERIVKCIPLRIWLLIKWSTSTYHGHKKFFLLMTTISGKRHIVWLVFPLPEILRINIKSSQIPLFFMFIRGHYDDVYALDQMFGPRSGFCNQLLFNVNKWQLYISKMYGRVNPRHRFLLIDGEKFKHEPWIALEKIETAFGLEPFFTRERFGQRDDGFYCIKSPTKVKLLDLRKWTRNGLTHKISNSYL